MTAIRLLHVDDEPDIREVVEISLALDPDFTVRSCSSGQEAIVEAAAWLPDIILLDVMMPSMDGPTTLGHLQQAKETANIPVLFMTARVQAREIEQFCSLGARGVIAKPFDPMTLASSIKKYFEKPVLDLSGPRARFLERAREMAALLQAEKLAVAQGEFNETILDRLCSVAHKLVGGGATLGFKEIGDQARDLEDIVSVRSSNPGALNIIPQAIDALAEAIKRA